MEKGIIKDIITDKGVSEFQVRLLQEDGVGLLTTPSNDNYLILDSLDYWYDLIQNEYPKKKKCSCGNDWFKVQFEYITRSDSPDFREIRIVTTCTSCNKMAKPVLVDIDYSPTEHLLSNPLTYCEQPKIKYKFSELSCYWSGDDLKNVLFFIFNEFHMHVYCWFFKYPEDQRYFEKVDLSKAMQIITANHRYLNFYFSMEEMDIHDVKKLEDEKGMYIKQDRWRKHEIITLSSPYVINGYGLLYYIHFCDQLLDKGVVKDKSKAFGEITTKLQRWLKEQFITKRGKNCYDGVEAYTKLTAK